MIDLTIIGGGAAGCRAAGLAAKAGFSVVLIEGASLGGSAIHDGYWPYRYLMQEAALLHSSNVHQLTQGSNVYRDILERIQRTVTDMSGDTRDLLTSLGVEIVSATGHVKGLRSHRYVVTTGDNFYESRRLLLAMGSLPAIPDLPDLDKYREEGFVITPNQLALNTLPRKALIAGGTLRDLQVAIWLSANGTDVTLCAPDSRIVKEFDEDICTWLSGRIPNVRCLTHAKIVSLGHQRVTITEVSGGRTVTCDKVILGGQRTPATRGIGLGSAAIATEDGAIITDLTCHTNLPDVFAAGDVNMRTQSALGAYREAEVCVGNMLGRRSAMNYQSLPYLLDSFVKAASVGETEQSADAMGLRVTTVCVPVSARNRQMTDSESGLVKLVADSDTGRLLGAHLCGTVDGLEVIWTLASLIEGNVLLTDAYRLLTPHSTFSDAIQQALFRL